MNSELHCIIVFHTFLYIYIYFYAFLCIAIHYGTIHLVDLGWKPTAFFCGLCQQTGLRRTRKQSAWECLREECKSFGHVESNRSGFNYTSLTSNRLGANPSGRQMGDKWGASAASCGSANPELETWETGERKPGERKPGDQRKIMRPDHPGLSKE